MEKGQQAEKYESCYGRKRLSKLIELVENLQLLL